MTVHRKRDDERGPAPGFDFHIDRTAVRGDDSADQTQSESKSALSPALIAAIETLPDVRQIVRRDPDTGIRNSKAHDRAITAGTHRNAATCGRVFDGIVGEIGEHLTQAPGISRHGQA